MATSTQQHQRAIGLFSTRREAETALHKLRDAGFDMNKISVVAANADGTQDMAGARVEHDKGEQVKGGAGAGASAGAVTGGLMGLIGGLGVLAIPGIGVAAEVGIVLANTLLGSGIGAAGGGLIGALVGFGVPEDRAKYYNDRVYTGGDYLILVDGTDQDIRNAQAVLNDYGIRDWSVFDHPGTTTGNMAGGHRPRI